MASPQTRRRPAASRSKLSRRARAFGWLAIVPLALGLMGAAYLLLVYPSQQRTGRGRLAQVQIPPHAGPARVAQLLAEARLIDRPRVFAAYLRIFTAGHDMRDGRLAMRDDLTPGEVARRLVLGGATTVRVTVPEGSNRFEIARRLEAQGVCTASDFLEVTARRTFLDSRELGEPTAEGYLFPDTYDLRTRMPAASAAARMIQNFRRRMLPLLEERAEGMARLRSELDFGLRDVVTLASIVEEEAAVSEERPVIAGVFLNRLRSDTFLPHHRLQADPTVSYGCLLEPDSAPSCADFDGRHISRAMLRDAANRYNTYRHGGLPPGPISNPGLDSLRAVLDPAVHEYLYFVARGHRRHSFSVDLDTHNSHVDDYVERQRAAHRDAGN